MNPKTSNTKYAIDINTDAGEGFFLPPLGLDLEILRNIQSREGERFHRRHDCERHDESLLSIVTSINLACGMHSGDPITMDQAIVAGKSRGVGMGAHPSYPDLFGFGQNHIDVSDDQLQSILLYQLGALNAILKRHNQELQHVKCHGALYFDISQNEGTCRALLAAIDRIKPTPILVLPSGSKMVSLLRREGIPIAEEIAIDRGYDRSGEMLPRSHPDALITDPKLVADRLIRLLKGGVLRTGLVETAPVQAQTVCLHADTPGATQIGSAVRRVLLMEDIAVRPMAEIIKNQHE